MDLHVIPMVNYFNKQGLKTYMSCEGHNIPNMSMFWIQFDKSITEKDIIAFQEKHSRTFKGKKVFSSCGRFAQRIYLAPCGIERNWNYFAANIEAANKDLEHWTNI